MRLLLDTQCWLWMQASSEKLNGHARELPTWVPLGSGDPLVGYINTDDLRQLHRDELHDLLGSLSPRTFQAVNDALRIVLALP